MAFPTTEADVESLLQIWAMKAPNHAAQFGLTQAQLDQMSDDFIVYGHLRLVRQILDDEVAEFSAYKSLYMEGNPNTPETPYPTIEIPPMPPTVKPPKPGIEERNKNIYNYFKNHPNRTDEALADLGVHDAPKPPVPLADIKPTLSGQSQPDDVISLTFKKMGQPSVKMFMRRNGGDWESIAEPTNSPYTDETPSVDSKPEKREYRCICLKNNKPVGQYSDIITIFTTP